MFKTLAVVVLAAALGNCAMASISEDLYYNRGPSMSDGMGGYYDHRGNRHMNDGMGGYYHHDGSHQMRSGISDDDYNLYR